MATASVNCVSMEHFAFTLFVYQYTESEDFNIIFDSLHSKQLLILKRVSKTIKKMEDIYGKIFDDYFEKLNDDYYLCSIKYFAQFVLARIPDFCKSPSFYNFLLVCLFMCLLLQSQPQCLLLVKTAAKCVAIVYSQRYEDFFMANGGLTGMRKYFDEIEEEDLRSFVSSHVNRGILIPTFEDVLKIVREFDEFGIGNTQIGDTDLKYLHDDYYPFEEIHNVRRSLKLSKFPETLNFQDENKTLEYLLENLSISSGRAVNRLQTKCSYCGEKCFKYVMFHVLFRLRGRSTKEIK
ncbi:hypothetical protein CEXT_119711 [Caerostris extrusa]|uniref:Uncharacterized protein n=1 Tax=Caerostris extrusa TaxID=172846 RepID=A0AAV4W7U7_CAEEX|nr:hypothetical protein CEXT_119711 [Caerostris extrusa]